MENIISFCHEMGIYGLMLLAFADSFISPIMPDIVMVPLSLAEPNKAIYFSLAATIASVAGGFVGYSIGAKLGPLCINRFVPPQHWERIRNLVEKHGLWAVFWGALMPIPYKFVAISAGVLGLNRNLFLVITIIGRGKRYLIEGALLYYFGAPLARAWEQYNQYGIWIVAIVAAVSLLCLVPRKVAPDCKNTCDK